MTLAMGNEPCADAVPRFKFGVGFLLGADADGFSGATGCRKPGKFRKRGFGRAEAVDEVAKGGGTDILAADQPEPVEPLPVGQSILSNI